MGDGLDDVVPRPGATGVGQGQGIVHHVGVAVGALHIVGRGELPRAGIVVAGVVVHEAAGIEPLVGEPVAAGHRPLDVAYRTIRCIQLGGRHPTRGRQRLGDAAQVVADLVAERAIDANRRHRSGIVIFEGGRRAARGVDLFLGADILGGGEGARGVDHLLHTFALTIVGIAGDCAGCHRRNRS